MIDNHYCVAHKAVFFKKGKMKGYAHTIGDTGEWCNEPEGGGDPMPAEKKAELEAEASGNNRSYALAYAKDIGVALIGAGKSTSAMTIIETAVLFESYLDSGASVTTKKKPKPIEPEIEDRPF